MPSKHFEVSIDIDAPPERVWDVLTDADAYTAFDPNMIEITGPIAEGNKLAIRTKLSPNQTFRPTVQGVEPNRRMVWHSGMPFGLFTGDRVFTLTPTDGGGTHFHMEETFAGPMMAMIGGTIPDMTQPFNDFATGLKEKVEG